MLVNNPFVTGAPFTGTYSTDVGAEVLSADNAYSGTTFDPWTATPSTGVAAWAVDFGSVRAPTFIGIAAHNLAHVSATVVVQYSSDGTSWTTADGLSDTPADNQAIGFRLSGSVYRRYWRITITGATGDVSIGVIWIGCETIIPQRIYQGYTPPITPTQVDLNTNVSEGANLLGSAYVERGSTFQASFSHIDPEFLRGAAWKAFQNRWNRGQGAFWAWRPTKYGDLFYAWRSGGPIVPSNSGPQELMGFTLQGRLYDDP